jgi:hypothetical protein
MAPNAGKIEPFNSPEVRDGRFVEIQSVVAVDFERPQVCSEADKGPESILILQVGIIVSL